MTTWIHLPVDTPEMRGIAETWNRERVAKGKPAYTITGAADEGLAKGWRRLTGQGALRGVAAADKLYILAHGYSAVNDGPALRIGAARGAEVNNAFLNDYDGGRNKLHTPQTLARHIEKEGLLKAFVDLRLFACHAGRDINATTLSFGAQLKNALVGRGYAAVMVTAYLGAVSAGQNWRQVDSTNPDFTPYVSNTGFGPPFSPSGGKMVASTQHKGVTLPGAMYGEPAQAHRIVY
jgi:hypothetical protein